MRLKVKAGVRPRSFVLIAAVVNAALELGIAHDVTITSGTDGRHMAGSKHYSGEAIDVRSQNFPSLAAKRAFLRAVQQRLGPGYDCLLERVGTPHEHFHLERDV